MRRAFVSSISSALIVFATTGVAHADPSSTTIEQGYELGEVQHPRSIAMGGAQQAWGGSTTALFVNPANLTLYRVYHLEAIATFGPEARRQSYGGAIADSSTSKLAGGFGGTWSQMDPDGIKRSWTDLRLSLAYPIGDRLSIGMAGRYLRADQRANAGPLGNSRASGGTKDDPIASQFTFDAGIAVGITEQIRLGLTGRNLTAPGGGLMPLGTAGGIGYSNGTFTAEVDQLLDFSTFNGVRGRTMIGAEYLAADHFPIRAGYRFDAGMKTHALSLGAGYVDKRFSIEVGGRRDVVADHPATTISIGVRIFIDSAGSGTGDDSGPF